MDAMHVLTTIISRLPASLPMLIALVVGLVLVLLARELPVPVRRLGLLGFGVLLAAHLLSMLGWPVLQAYVLTAGVPAEQMAWIFAAMNVPLALLNAAGFVVLALAIVRRRQ